MWKRLFQNEVTKIALGDKKKNLIHYFLMIFLNILSAASEGASFAFLFFALNAFSTKSVPYIEKWIPSTFSSTQHVFLFCIAITVLLQIARSFLFFWNNVIFVKMTSKIFREVQKKIYDTILSFSYDCINRRNFGDMIQIANSPAHWIHPVFENLNKAIAELFNLIVILIIMIKLNFLLTLITLVIAGALTMIQKIMLNKIFSDSDKLSRKLGSITQETSQTLQGIKIVHAFHKQRLIKEKLSKKVVELVKILNKLYWHASAIAPIGEMISVTIVGSILLIGSMLIKIDGPAEISFLIMFLIMAYRFSGRIQVFINNVSSLAVHKGKINQIHELLNPADKEFEPLGGKNKCKMEREIKLQEVIFSYPGSSKVVLNKISIHISKGSFIALVGSSGSGKTTILDILLRLYQPQEGSVIIDKDNAASISLEAWRKLFGVITQDPFLFNDSIMENIRLGEDVSFDRIQKAAINAGADTFIEKLPKKYETIIGERGFRLSGGEKQRISIARMFLKNPEIIVLDEATSNLDSKTEEYIQNSLIKWKNKKTLVVVAHRLSTIARADYIYFMNNGKILEEGNHEQLLSLQGYYASMWNIQSLENVKRKNKNQIVEVPL